MKKVIILALGVLIWSGSTAEAQSAKGNKPAKQEQKSNPGKGKGKGKAKKATPASARFTHATPHKVNVPPGHYPPPGQCRIWYPGRPPGHQPPPQPCNQLVGVRLEEGAFILHGDRAYDTHYDWRQEEQKKPNSVPRTIFDILFPEAR